MDGNFVSNRVCQKCHGHCKSDEFCNKTNGKCDNGCKTTGLDTFATVCISTFFTYQPWNTKMHYNLQINQYIVYVEDKQVNILYDSSFI